MFDLDATQLLVWGIVAHLVADWLLQNEAMATKKMLRRTTNSKIYDRHPIAYLHSGIHGILLFPIFGWFAVSIAFTHLVIDCRWIVQRWSLLIKQTQPKEGFDIGADVRIWNDQVAHIFVIAVFALVLG